MDEHDFFLDFLGSRREGTIRGELFHGSRGNRSPVSRVYFFVAREYIFLAFSCLFIRVTRIRLKSTVTTAFEEIIRHKLSSVEKKKKKCVPGLNRDI